MAGFVGNHPRSVSAVVLGSSVVLPALGGLSAQAATVAEPVRDPSDPARVAMDAKLDEAIPGGIDASKIEAAKLAVETLFGDVRTKSALAGSLETRAGSLTIDAVEWLQKNYGSMDGHIARYQTVLRTYIEGASLLDADFNGKLDSSDLVFTADASGRVNVAKLEAALRDKVKIGGAVVSAAEDMAKAHHSFVDITPSGWKQEFNSSFWSGGPYTFNVKDGVKPSDALQDLFVHPSLYKFECGTAMDIVYNKAILDLIGPAAFDQLAPHLTIGPGYGTGMVPKYVEDGSTYGKAASNPLKAGDRGYIANWNASAEGRRLGWSGENVINLGDGKFYGHPFGIATAESMINFMNNHREAGSTVPASFSTMRGVLTPEILNLAPAN